MQAFKLSLSTLLLRYYLMMALIIAGVFTGQVWMAFLALPVFLSCLLGVKLTIGELTTQSRSATKRFLHSSSEDVGKAA